MQKIIFKFLLPHSPIQQSVLRQSYKLGILFFVSSMLSQIIAMLLDDVLKTGYLIEKGKMVTEYLQGGLTGVEI